MDIHAQRRLEELLDREIEAVHLLSGALTAERAALTGSVADEVSQRAAEKVRLLAQLESLEVERRALWGSGTDPHSGSDPVAGRWRMLLALLAGCRIANEVNGRIIHSRQNQIRQLIDIVRGGGPATYGPRGRTSAAALRALARA